MSEVHSWRNTPDARQLIEQAVRALSEGRLVVFPTDTGYVLGADSRHASAVERLSRVDGIGPARSLAVLGLAQTSGLFPDLHLLAGRLARRCWPGPLTLMVPESAGTASGLPAATRDCVRTDGWLSLSSPAHRSVLHALHRLDAPLVVAPLGSELPNELPEGTALVIEDGPCPAPEGPTVVRVAGDDIEVLREGAYSEAQVRAQLASLILFVCTGNTCRSPLAEALCKKRLAERIGCTPEELPWHGFVVASAGLAAYPGDPAAEFTVRVADDHGMDLGGHLSRPLDRELAFQADHLICMTHGHMDALVASFPQLACAPRLLSAAGEDLPDPVGQDESVYRACAERIRDDLEALVGELLPG